MAGANLSMVSDVGGASALASGPRVGHIAVDVGSRPA